MRIGVPSVRSDGERERFGEAPIDFAVALQRRFAFRELRDELLVRREAIGRRDDRIGPAQAAIARSTPSWIGSSFVPLFALLEISFGAPCVLTFLCASAMRAVAAVLHRGDLVGRQHALRDELRCEEFAHRRMRL